MADETNIASNLATFYNILQPIDFKLPSAKFNRSSYFNSQTLVLNLEFSQTYLSGILTAMFKLTRTWTRNLQLKIQLDGEQKAKQV